MYKAILKLVGFYIFLCGLMMVIRTIIGIFLDREFARGCTTDITDIFTDGKASSIGIIGGADGPTAVFIGGKQRHKQFYHKRFSFLLTLYALLAQILSFLGFGKLYNFMFRKVKRRRRKQSRSRVCVEI